MNKIKPYLEKYTEQLKDENDLNESYKWEAINHFQENWNIDANDFKPMFLESFGKVSNLLYQNSWGFIKKAVNHYDEVVKGMFKRLYDESKPLIDRIKDFETKSEELLEAVKKAEGNDNLNAQQDERTISVYLSFMYPEKYFIYMYSFYENICDCLEVDTEEKGKRYSHYLSIAEEIKRNQIIDNDEIRELHDINFPHTEWNDNNLITQNFFFSIFRDKENYKTLKSNLSSKLNNSIYFGKITNQNNQNNQLDEKYYFAYEKSWFGDLKEDDYVFVIGGQKISLWKAIAWEERTDAYKMNFDEIIHDLDINTKDLQALKFFKLDVDLIVKTVRSTAKSKRAFFKISTHSEFTEENLLDIDFYQNQNNYRQIKVLEESILIPNEQFDLQIYKHGNNFNIQMPEFSDDLGTFIDNTKFIGKGRKNKDKTLKKINDSINKSWNHKDISMMNFYDAFFCEYNAKEIDGLSFLELFGEWLDLNYNSVTHYNLLTQTKLYIDDLVDKGIIDKKLLDDLEDDTIQTFTNHINNFKPSIENINYLIEFLKENSMTYDIFKQFEDYLSQYNFTKGTIGAYVGSVNYKVPKEWKAIYKTDFSEFTQTLENLKKLKKITNKTYQGEFKGKENFKSFLIELINNYKMKSPLNQILYGPPGTGKTFKIISEYVLDKNTKIEQVDESKLYVNEKKNFWHLAPGESGYLWNDLKTQNYLGYEWCSISLGDLKNLKKEDVDNFTMKSRFSKVKESDYFCIISGKKFYGIAKALHGYDFEKSEESDFDFQTIKVEWIKQFDKPELLNTYSAQSFSGTKGGKRWNSIIKSLENRDIYFSSKKGEKITKSSNNYAMVSFHQSFSYEDFIEGIKPDLELNIEENENKDLSYIIQDGIFKIACDKAANIAGYDDLVSCLDDTKENRQKTFEVAEPFYLLIDEINRGNISSIFGELITLLEDDKRLGSKHELMLDLPYSKKTFGIPRNLHIIGTMNTADRSVEALDTALRRRFSFVEISPDSEVLKQVHSTNAIVESIDLAKLLDTINDRIELLIDKDHKIGHSYFINVLSLNDLIQTFKDKVIPLLEEYFYGDFGKIGLVLGKAFIGVVNKDSKAKLAKFEHEDSDILSDKKLYCFTNSDTWKTKSFQSIYNTSIVIDE